MSHDKYKIVKVGFGATISEAVEKLQSYKFTYAKLEFNGVWLYSDTVTLDSAYQQIVGMPYSDFLLRLGRK